MADTPSRKLAVIMHADVVGSTGLVRRNETLAHQRIKDVFARFAKSIESYGGIPHELRGDALVAEFARASDAVCTAIAFQDENAAFNASLEDDLQPRLRIGISLGEVVVADNTITGDGVVLAQRLEQIADPGGVCIQGAAYETVPKRLPFAYESLGDQTLKGFDEPVRAYGVTLTAGKDVPPPEPSESVQAELKLPDAPSIAVLPFTNMSGDPEQEYFSDGITEDIITQLSQFSGLFVIARNSSYVYKGQAIDIRSVARELGVRYVLEGSVRRAGSRLRVTAQLLDSTSAAHVWAERYEGGVSDVFELQDEITRGIVGSIAPQIELAELKRGRGLRSGHLTSYELSLKAQAMSQDAMRAGDPDGLQRSIEVAQRALDIDDRNVRALWTQALGYMYSHLQRWGDDPDRALNSLLGTSEMLIQVDSSYPNAYVARAMARQFQGDFDAAVADFHRALALNPNLALTLFMAAWSESLAGLTEEAKKHAELALRLSPKDQDMWLGCAYLALLEASFAEQDFEESKKWGRLAVQMHATAPIRRALMIASCAYTGDFAGAAIHAEALNSFAPGFVSALLRGEMNLYKHDEHNLLLIEGLKKAGLSISD